MGSNSMFDENKPIVRKSHVKWLPTVSTNIDFGSTDTTYAKKILRDMIRDELPLKANTKQAVYVIRLYGPVIIDYPRRPSPTIYIGEGDCINRLTHGHSAWLSAFLESLKEFGLSIAIALPKRKKFTQFYKCIEADLIKFFYQEYGALPFFNRQHEKKFRDRYSYTKDVVADFRKAIQTGSGNKPLWSIKPLSERSAVGFYKTGMPES